MRSVLSNPLGGNVQTFEKVCAALNHPVNLVDLTFLGVGCKSASDFCSSREVGIRETQVTLTTTERAIATFAVEDEDWAAARAVHAGEGTQDRL